MRKNLGIVGMLVTTLSLSACLEKETTHTLYLSPDGAVTWIALERDVRSAGGDSGSRAAEESEYLASASAGTNDIANGLVTLDPLRVRTRVLRRERPFSVMTEARFAAVEGLANQVIAAFRLPGDAYVTRDAGRVTLHIHLDLRGERTDQAESTPVAALLDELTTYRVVLTAGQFVSAVGFTLSDDGTIARPIELTDEEAGGVVDLSLTWK